MKTALCLSLSLALSLAASLPALAQNGFGQMPANQGGFGGGGQAPGSMPNPAFGGGGMMPVPNNQGGFGGATIPPQFNPGGLGTGGGTPPNANPGFGINTPNPGFVGTQQPDPNAILIQQLQQMAQLELQDYGVQPTQQLHDGAMHGPTPSSIPGARVTTTAELFQLVMGNSQPYLLFDVLGGDQALPGAIPAVNAAQPGSFQDQTQQGFGQFLQQVTGGRQDAMLVFYCASTQCWMSYNAALRAANLGYRNVLWYRGGLEAWSYAGLPTMPPGGGMMPNVGGGGGGTMQPMGN